MHFTFVRNKDNDGRSRGRGGAKRRKISPSSNSSGISLFDLPNGALSYAANFLPRPSRAMFAVAVVNYLGDLGDDELMCKAILGEQYDVLDFGEIEASLASKLTDEDLKSILICIDANTNMKKMKLAGCINITGAGLSSLRGTVVLQQIDLSLVAKHKSPVLYLPPQISCEHVLPILDSIIEREDNVLRSITFPESWRREENVVLNEFMERCNQVFESRNVTCVKCSASVEDSNLRRERQGLAWFHIDGHGNCGVQNFTCYDCIKYFCFNCIEDEGTGRFFLLDCENCKKSYCKDCGSIEECAKCAKSYCKGCKLLEKCGECDDYYCKDCQPFVNCGGSPEERLCSRRFCGYCASRHTYLGGQIQLCYECEVPFCDSCWASHRCENCGAGYCRKCHGSNDMSCCDQCL